MGTIDDLMGDAMSLALDTDAFGESFAYLPRGNATTPRAISGIVDREAPDQPAGGNVGFSSPLRITVMNDATTGIASAELDTGLDLVEIARRPGETPRRFNIARIVQLDPSMMTLELR